MRKRFYQLVIGVLMTGALLRPDNICGQQFNAGLFGVLQLPRWMVIPTVDLINWG